jgi:peptidoglycan/xylan/chitin deacetylase (PgdA/CDA1 family)
MNPNIHHRNNNKASILLAFDDNVPTHLDIVIPELERRQMPGTFYINAGTGHFQERREAWEQAAQSPFVAIANHTFSHRGVTGAAQLEEELEQNNKVLYALNPDLPAPRPLAFGRPGGVPWTVSEDEELLALNKFYLVRRPRFYSPAMPQKTPDEITVELIALVDDALATGNTVQIGFHGVGGDWHSTPAACFLALLDKLDLHRDELWITDPVSLSQATAL